MATKREVATLRVALSCEKLFVARTELRVTFKRVVLSFKRAIAIIKWLLGKK